MIKIDINDDTGGSTNPGAIPIATPAPPIVPEVDNSGKTRIVGAILVAAAIAAVIFFSK